MTTRYKPKRVGDRNPDLTQREQEVIVLVVEGCTDQEIAERFTISVHTVRRHRLSAYHKLDVHNRSEAIVAWRRLMTGETDRAPDVTVTVRHGGLKWHGPLPLSPPPDA